MKNKPFLIVCTLFFLCVQMNMAQEKSKKEIKAEKELQKQKEIETLVQSKTFEFDANFVQPLGRRDLNIQGEQYVVEYKPAEIKSYLPYFGRGYNVGYGGDTGLKFTGKPENFTIEKKKKYYLIKTTVKGENDVFNLSLSVYFQGSATLTVTSNQRDAISYTGTIEVLKTKE
ncbi:DUF4251 domain-containing protein [Flavobacterium agrisoli]|uniref:DUF4251 domain-containing protein n=1 Tax=Flavobacterium agrisoli TaxID=2793066 RepID=A0A934UJJ8_9FLAO|nr:DUF4251 domain-containing protein [Flavobacterium agrisoli]MBK0370036.1 DUF4251 domain-containing protein [Flavobacterium agrisoli]